MCINSASLQLNQYLLSHKLSRTPQIRSPRTCLLVIIVWLSPLTIAQEHIVSAPPLLQMAKQDDCIQRQVSPLLQITQCAAMPESAKAELALAMTNCLLTRMGKDTVQCRMEAKQQQSPQVSQKQKQKSRSQLPKCSPSSLSSESWTTFTTFFAHIDNLCNFHWQQLRHRRAQSLMQGLSKSAEDAKAVLIKTGDSTRQLLLLQKGISEGMGEAVKGQKQMGRLLGEAEIAVTEVVTRVEGFMGKMESDIDEHYGSIVTVLAGIDAALQNVQNVQYFVMAEIRSVNGVLYFGLMLAVAVWLSGWVGVVGVAVTLGVEICFPVVAGVLGVGLIRGFALVAVLVGWSSSRQAKYYPPSCEQLQKWRNYKQQRCPSSPAASRRQLKALESQLKTTRLLRILKEAQE